MLCKMESLTIDSSKHNTMLTNTRSKATKLCLLRKGRLFFKLRERLITNNIAVLLSLKKIVPVVKTVAVRLVTGLSPRRPGFAPGSLHVGFVDKVALEQVSLRVLRFSAVNISFHYCSILICQPPMRCVISLTKQHSIIPSVLSCRPR
jgi:hypothetical protein